MLLPAAYIIMCKTEWGDIEMKRAESELHLPNARKIRKLLAQENDSATATIIRLAWQAGLTATEIADLRWMDVDLTNRTISASGRSVPICEELTAFLSAREHDGAFVVSSPVGVGGRYNRVSVSRKARVALDAIGEAKVRLLDLRFDFIVQMLKVQPMENVARATNCELRTLQEIYKRFGLRGPKLQRALKHYDGYDNHDLLRAVCTDRDRLDAKIVMLSWMCGLSLTESSNLKWKDVDLMQRVLYTGGEKRLIPEELIRLLAESEISADQYVLQGKRSGNKLDVDFLSRRAGEFLSRNGLEKLTLNGIRGKFVEKSDDEIAQSVIEMVDRERLVSAAQITAFLGVGRNKSKTILNSLAADGKLRYLKDRKLYAAVDYQTNWDKFIKHLDEYPNAHSEISREEMAKATEFKATLLSYYINRAIAQGILAKSGRARYHLCGRSR